MEEETGTAGEIVEEGGDGGKGAQTIKEMAPHPGDNPAMEIIAKKARLVQLELGRVGDGLRR